MEGPLDRDSALKHLDTLNSKMDETRQDANELRNKFHFGGIIVVIGLLNADLVVANALEGNQIGAAHFTLFTTLAYLIAGIYFWLISKNVAYHRSQYRMTKHKYELTLYALQLEATNLELLNALETSPKEEKKAVEYDNISNFSQAARYLHDHHARRLAYHPGRNWLVAMLVVTLAVIAKFFTISAISG